MSKTKPNAKGMVENVRAMVEKMKQVEERRAQAKTYCYHCKNETKQTTLFEKGEIAEPQETVFFDEKGKRKGSHWTIEARIWKITQCQGCEKINLNVFMRYHPAEDDVLIHHFPVKPLRPFPMWITHVNKETTHLLAEIYVALNAGNIRLPLMGARTLLDMFIVEKIGDVGTFKAKLQRLVDEKYISEPSRQLLEIVLEYGHATIHRGYSPSQEEINGVLDILENVLHAEALQDQSSSLKKTIPSKK